MNTKNRKQLLVINVILICVMLNMVATISEMTSIDQVMVENSDSNFVTSLD